METEPWLFRETTSAIIGDDPGLPGDPETLKLGRWVGVDGGGRSHCRGPAPFSAGARDGKAELHGDRVCCSHFSREASRVALLAARGDRKGWEYAGARGWISAVGCILGVQPLAIWPGQSQVLQLPEPSRSQQWTRLWGVVTHKAELPVVFVPLGLVRWGTCFQELTLPCPLP